MKEERLHMDPDTEANYLTEFCSCARMGMYIFLVVNFFFYSRSR